MKSRRLLSMERILPPQPPVPQRHRLFLLNHWNVLRRGNAEKQTNKEATEEREIEDV
jgi:hypothetical protein